MKNKIRLVVLLVVAITAAAFFVARNAIFAPVAGSAAGDAMRQELARAREEFERQARELEEIRKEVRIDVREIRKTEYTRRQALPPDDIAVELAALLEQSRREHTDEH